MSAGTAQFLPKVEGVCDGASGDLLDPQGRPLPPCIVMEKGESLQDYSERAEPDLFTSLAVRMSYGTHICVTRACMPCPCSSVNVPTATDRLWRALRLGHFDSNIGVKWHELAREGVLPL